MRRKVPQQGATKKDSAPRHADISQIARAISRRDIHAPAKRDSEVSKVAAHAPLLGKTSRLLEHERAHARPIAMVRGHVGSAHGRELGLRPSPPHTRTHLP
jgi:hypothetical protein